MQDMNLQLNQFTLSQNYLIQSEVSSNQIFNIDLNSNQYYVYPVRISSGFVSVSSVDKFQDYTVFTFWTDSIGLKSLHRQIPITNRRNIKYEFNTDEINYISNTNFVYRKVVDVLFDVYYFHVFNTTSNDVNTKIQFEF